MTKPRKPKPRSKQSRKEVGQPRDVVRNLMVGLIYPAILGTGLYSFLDTLLRAVLGGAEQQVLQQQGLVGVSIKVLLFLITLFFYCCDYVYTCWVENYRVHYFLLDLIVIFTLCLTMTSVNLSSPNSPSLRTIAVCYSIIMICYFFVDLIDLRPKRYNRYFRLISTWEIVGVIVMVLFVTFCSYLPVRFEIRALLLCTLLLTLTGWYIWLIRKKKELAAF
jgi:hypothetical protein